MARRIRSGLMWSKTGYLTLISGSHSRSASSYKNLRVDVDGSTGTATVTLKKPPVNSLNTEMLQEISKAIKELEGTKGCRGFVLTSEVPKIFSGGLDIMEMYQPKTGHLKEFWTSVQQMWIDLYMTKLATVAAITGHAPAGGCLMAVSCDYRIMAPKFNIGLNETLLGIVAPFWFKDTLQNVVGARETEVALSLGKMYATDEALKKGIVDEMASSPEDALQKAREELLKWIKIPNHARVATKQSLREPIVQRLLKFRDTDTEHFITFVSNEMVQKALGSYLAALKGRKH